MDLWEPWRNPRLDSITCFFFFFLEWKFCSSLLIDITDFTWMSVTRITAHKWCQRAGEQLRAEVMGESWWESVGWSLYCWGCFHTVASSLVIPPRKCSLDAIKEVNGSVMLPYKPCWTFLLFIVHRCCVAALLLLICTDVIVVFAVAERTVVQQ